MNTFRATILPCAGTAGGVPAQPSAAGRPIVVRAYRPTISKHAGGNSPIFVDDVFASVRDRLGITAARGCRTTDHGQPVPTFFFGLARDHACQQSSRCFADVFHDQISFRDAHAFHLQESIGATHEHGAIDQDRGFFSQGGTHG